MDARYTLVTLVLDGNSHMPEAPQERQLDVQTQDATLSYLHPHPPPPAIWVSSC